MIVDVHYHMYPSDMSEAEARQRAERYVIFGAKSGINKSMDQVLAEYLDLIQDPDGQKLLERMGRTGIDVTVMCVVDRFDGVSQEAILEQNKACAQIANRNPGRILALAGVDPRRGNAPQLVKKCIQEYGMHGLKWHPDRGFYPNSDEAYRVLTVVEALGVPLLTHTGPLPPPSRNKFVHPIYLDDVTVDFPRLKVIAAHMGHIWLRDWCALAHFNDNLFGDLAEWQFDAVANYEMFCKDLREAIDRAGVESILFGTDAPAFDTLIPSERWLQIIKDLPRNAPGGIKFTEDEVVAILGGNAQRVFGL